MLSQSHAARMVPRPGSGWGLIRPPLPRPPERRTQACEGFISGELPCMAGVGQLWASSGPALGQMWTIGKPGRFQGLGGSLRQCPAPCDRDPLHHPGGFAPARDRRAPGEAGDFPAPGAAPPATWPPPSPASRQLSGRSQGRLHSLPCLGPDAAPHDMPPPPHQTAPVDSVPAQKRTRRHDHQDKLSDASQG